MIISACGSGAVAICTADLSINQVDVIKLEVNGKLTPRNANGAVSTCARKIAHLQSLDAFVTVSTRDLWELPYEKSNETRAE